jgi:hypothetical protein
VYVFWKSIHFPIETYRLDTNWDSNLDRVKADTSASAIYGYTALMALGVGAYNQAGYSVVQAKVPKAEIPWALGYMMVCK